MEIKFRYIDEDYIEFNKFYNEYLGLNKRGRLTNSILLPGILFFVLLTIVESLGVFFMIPFLIWIIFTIIWIVFNKSIYNYKFNKSLKYALRNDKMKGIDFYKDTKITLSDEGIKKDVEGIEIKVKWEALEKVYVDKKNIYIKLVNATYINIPIRALENSKRKEEFLKIINKYIKSDFGLIY